MNKAFITLTKYKDIFQDRETGKDTEYEYVEVEFAPNLCVKLSLKNSNLRVLAKYNPDFYQLVCNIPHYDPITFAEYHDVPEEPVGDSGLKDIYSNNESFDDEEENNHKSRKRVVIH